MVEGRICELRNYNGGERLLVLIDDQLMDATVAAPALNRGALHSLSIAQPAKPGGAPTKPTFVSMDLNDFNHCHQLFTSVEQYEATRSEYLKDLVERLAFVEDAITGNRLNIDDQVRAVDLHVLAPVC